MREEDVPQDDSFYGGHLRACYAVDRTGKYVLATSRGWEAERAATARALADLEAKVESARRAVIAGAQSPLAYHMAVAQMTPRLLAQNAGTWTWRVRRHMRPDVFRRLDGRVLARYAACLALPVESLLEVPRESERVFSAGKPGADESGGAE